MFVQFIWFIQVKKILSLALWPKKCCGHLISTKVTLHYFRYRGQFTPDSYYTFRHYMDKFVVKRKIKTNPKKASTSQEKQLKQTTIFSLKVFNDKQILVSGINQWTDGL